MLKLMLIDIDNNIKYYIWVENGLEVTLYQILLYNNVYKHWKIISCTQLNKLSEKIIKLFLKKTTKVEDVLIGQSHCLIKDKDRRKKYIFL